MLSTKLGRLLPTCRQRLCHRYYHPAQANFRIKPITTPVINFGNFRKEKHSLLPNQTNVQFLRLLSVASIKYQNVSQTEAVEAASAVLETVINNSVPGSSSEAAEAASGVIDSIISSSLNSPSGGLVSASIPAESVSSLGSSTAESVTSSVGSLSTVAADSNELILDFIPEKPLAVDATTILGEPSFESLDLASWWPSGRLQYFMEQIHLGCGLEWWQTILLTTFCVRLLVFPLVIMAQKNVAAMNNIMPEMSKIQSKLTDARRRGDVYESAQLGQQLQVFMSKEGVNPLKNILPVLFQLPIFMSMFLGLRGMANCPVPSMDTGGFLWIENLTMADPFYLLPFLTSTTLYIQFKLGTEGVNMDSMGPMGKTAMKVFPFVLIPMTMNFPAAVTFYWFCTNVISVGQGRFVRLPAVRKVLGMPEFIKWDHKKLAEKTGKKKGFRESVRETIDNWKVQSDISDRRLFDEQQFRDAGSAPPIKTYKFDPTKPQNLKRK